MRLAMAMVTTPDVNQAEPEASQKTATGKSQPLAVYLNS